MKTFTDNTGRAWTIAINVDAVKRVKALAKVDLLEAVEGKLIERLVSDPVLLCDVVYCLCKPQADQLGVSDEDFGRAMAGDAIEQATAAMLEELVDFFPSRRRALLTKAVGKFKKLQETVISAAETRLDSGMIEKLMARELAEMEAEMAAMLSAPKVPGGQSGSSPESSEPIPAR